MAVLDYDEKEIVFYLSKILFNESKSLSTETSRAI